jgi:hypothetical protein
VDGEWQNDPHAPAHASNEFGSTDCVLEVPPAEANHRPDRPEHQLGLRCK